MNSFHSHSFHLSLVPHLIRDPLQRSGDTKQSALCASNLLRTCWCSSDFVGPQKDQKGIHGILNHPNVIRMSNLMSIFKMETQRIDFCISPVRPRTREVEDIHSWCFDVCPIPWMDDEVTGLPLIPWVSYWVPWFPCIEWRFRHRHHTYSYIIINVGKTMS